MNLLLGMFRMFRISGHLLLAALTPDRLATFVRRPIVQQNRSRERRPAVPAIAGLGTALIAKVSSIFVIVPFLAAIFLPNDVIAQVGTWTTKKPIPTASYSLGAAFVGGKFYAISGFATARLGIYDPTTDSWTTGAPLPADTGYNLRQSFGTAVVDGKIYVVGGDTGGSGDRATLYRYDPALDVWTTLAPMPQGPRYSLGAAAINGKIYAVGGYTISSAAYLTRLEVYDPLTNTWAAKASMPIAHAGALVGAVNGKLLVAGGSNASGPLTAVEVYDPTTDSWSAGAPMPFTGNGDGVVLGGKLFSIGAGPSPYSRVYAYTAFAWTTSFTPMPTGRWAVGVAADEANNSIYVVGGWNGSYAAALEVFVETQPLSTTTTTAPITTTTTSTTIPPTTTTTAPTTTTTTTAGTTTTTNVQIAFGLGAGWNLVGNSSTGIVNAATAFGDTTKVSTVWKWIADLTKWAFYAPSLAGQALADYAASKGYDVLTTINGGEGYWVNAKTAFAVQIPSGTTVTSAAFQNIASGWSSIAIGDSKTPSQFNQELSGSLNAGGKIMVTAWAWDAPTTAWKFYAPALEAQGGTVLADYATSKGYLPFSAPISITEGFWLNIAGPVTIALPPTYLSGTTCPVDSNLQCSQWIANGSACNYQSCTCYFNTPGVGSDNSGYWHTKGASGNITGTFDCKLDGGLSSQQISVGSCSLLYSNKVKSFIDGCSTTTTSTTSTSTTTTSTATTTTTTASTTTTTKAPTTTTTLTPTTTTTTASTTTTTATTGTYYWANWNCGTSSQCATVMGAYTGSTGLLCTINDCTAWKNIYFPGAACSTTATYAKRQSTGSNGVCNRSGFDF